MFRITHCSRQLLLISVLATSMGCAALTSSITSDFAADLSTAMLEQNDPETVKQGMPAYLILLESRLVAHPDDADLLLSAARLYSSYASTFVDDLTRSRVLSLKAKKFAWRGFCQENAKTCDVWELPYDQFEAIVDSFDPDDKEALFITASSWATCIQANKADWSAIADKARVEKMMQRLVELDHTYENGSPHAYLGVLATLLPEALGGNPEQGRSHFEDAVTLSQGRNLMFKVLFADKYARLVFDRELHDRLCNEVLDAQADEPGLTLANTIAIEQAASLRADSEDYFGE